eukprot:64205_1
MSALTAAETELYDRQIRAWGFEAQKRMRESKILVVGLDGAGSENLKNLVLAGLGNITILENKSITPLLIETHFYLQPMHLNQNFADIALQYFREMNPNIKLSTCLDDPYTKTDAFYKTFDVVIVNHHSRYLQLRINAICTQNKIGFFSCRSIGAFGYIFADLQCHQYQIASKNKKDDDQADTKSIECLNWYPLQSALSISNASMEKQMRAKSKKYRALFYALQVCEQTEDKILQMNHCFKSDKARDEHLVKAMNTNNTVFKGTVDAVKQSGQFKEIDMKNELVNDLLRMWNKSVCPTNAMLGGYLANFVMFYVQRKQKPLHNFLFFDMWSCEALEVLMKSEKNEMDVEQIAENDKADKSFDMVLLDDSSSDDEDIDLID